MCLKQNLNANLGTQEILTNSEKNWLHGLCVCDSFTWHV